MRFYVVRYRKLGDYFARDFFSRTFLGYLVPLFLLIAFVLIRYHSVADSFWLGDDTQILLTAIKYRPWEYFSSPTVWQAFSANNLTPWISLSFAIDWNIFGLDPRNFYLHQLVSLCAVAAVTYIVLRLWFSSLFSFLGVLLFVASPALGEAARMLMVRHYIEGLLFALLSIYFFVKALRNDAQWFLVLSAIFYLLACSAKEIYVPLIFVLFLLQKGSLQDRLRHILPCFFVTIVYIFWRWYMLGRLSGGYGLHLSLQDAERFLPRVVDAMSIDLDVHLKLWWRWIVMITSLCALTVLFLLDKKLFMILGVVLIIVLLPIVPVSSIMASRYVLLFSLCWAVLHVATWDILVKKWASLPAWGSVIMWGTMLVSISIFTSSAGLASVGLVADRQGKEGAFFLERGNKLDLLLNPASPGWYFEGLSWLRTQILHLTEGPALNTDTRLLCLENQLHLKYERVWYFDPGKRDMVSENVREYSDRFCTKELLSTVQKKAPLSVVLEYRNNEIVWEFGPHINGTYVLLFGNAAESLYPLPVKGNRYVVLKDSSIQFRLRYSSPEGWVTYSPLLHLDITEQKGSLSWKK